MGIPTIVVKLDDGTGTFPYDITQYVRGVDGLTWGRGRPDEHQTIQPGSLSLTLENIDSRFTQGNATYHVQPDQMIRLTVAGGVVWTGRVPTWASAWPGGDDTFSTVVITATDLLATLSRQTLRSAIDEEFAADGVVAHWPMNEAAGANSCHDIIGNRAGPRLKVAHAPDVGFGPGTVVVDPLFGVDLGVVDGSTGVQFIATSGLNGFLYGSGGSFSQSSAHIEFLFETLNSPTTAVVTLLRISPQLPGSFVVSYQGDGKITFAGPLFSAAVGSGLDDGLPHVVAFEGSATGYDVYIDGVRLYHDTTLRAASSFDLSEMFVGLSFNSSGSGWIKLAHLNIGAPISGARVAVHYNVITTDFLGELPTDRMTRLCTYTGAVTGTLDTTGFATCSRADQAGKTGLDIVNELADATDGIVYIDGNGHLSNITGYSITQQTFASAILDALWSSPDVQIPVDTLGMVNRADGHADGSENIFTFVDTGSILGSGTNPAHGIYPESYTWHVASDELAGDRTGWKVNRFSQPVPRAPELVFDLLTMDLTTLLQALTLDIGGFLDVSNMPSQTPGGDQFVIVQGFKASLKLDGANSEWLLTINGSRHAQSVAWILDDGFFGVLGASTTLYAG